MGKTELLRRIPAIEQILSRLQQEGKTQEIHHEVWVACLRKTVQEVRAELMLAKEAEVAGQTTEVLLRRIIEKTIKTIQKSFQPSLRSVVNATGIVLHTNLGRAPFSARAQNEVLNVMKGYSTLEYDVAVGRRGERYSHVTKLLEAVTGAEAALVVNNNAAAVLLTLGCVARGQEVLVSRGELVEIGGSFRIPDVIRQSGAVLVEVGTTNKTRLADYEKAITEKTVAILKVHTSNFALVGFTSQPAPEELCELSRKRGLLSINDVGSGTLIPFSREGYHEPTVQECIAAGFDLVTFSGDKLLGAGQAGIIAGKKEQIEKLKQEPLLRALRIDKLSLAALEGTLLDYASGYPEKLIPCWSMLTLSESDLKSKAKALVEKLGFVQTAGWQISIVPTVSLSGGGSLPAVQLCGYGVKLVPKGMSVAKLENCIRGAFIPIIALIREDALIIDVRCLLAGDEQIICAELDELIQGHMQ